MLRTLLALLVMGIAAGTGHAGLLVSLLPVDNSAVLPSDDPAAAVAQAEEQLRHIADLD